MEIQKLLFQKIKEGLPGHLSLVDEIAELLKISYDSAYRRIRCEKSLSVEELYTIANRFNLSVDALFNVNSNNVVFRNVSIKSESFGMKEWLRTVKDDMQRIHSSRVSEIIYAAKDPPIFHYFEFPEIGAFKMFFWEKTLFQFPSLTEKKFSLANMDPEIQEIGQNILVSSLKIPTIEIWNEDTFNIMFSQIAYYYVSGYFERKEDIFTLCDKLTLWIEHIKKQAECGFKFLYGTEPVGIENTYSFYENEVVLNDNTIYVKMDNRDVVYLTYNVVSLLFTSNPDFCSGVTNYFKGLIKQSTLISSVNAKERERFFNKLLEKIDQFRDSIK